MMSEPASMKARYWSRTLPGSSIFHSSGAKPIGKPTAKKLVPVAPSASSQGRSASIF